MVMPPRNGYWDLGLSRKPRGYEVSQAVELTSYSHGKWELSPMIIY